MVRACGTQKSSPLGRQQHRCVDPGEIFTPEMGSESSSAHPLPHPSHMHTLHRKPPNCYHFSRVLGGNSSLARSTRRLPRIKVCQHKAHAPQQLKSPLPSMVHLQAEHRQDGPLGMCLHQQSEVCINHRAIIRGKISSCYWQHLSLIPTLISTRGRFYKQQWWKRKGKKKNKKEKTIQRGEKKNQSKDNKSICEAGRNKLCYITWATGSLCPDKIFIQRIGIFFFNCLRRFKYIARYLQLYRGFLAMHHCSSLPLLGKHTQWVAQRDTDVRILLNRYKN